MAANSSSDISETKFLTVAEVAAMIRVSKMTVYRLGPHRARPPGRGRRPFRGREEDANEYLRKSFFNAG